MRWLHNTGGGDAFVAAVPRSPTTDWQTPLFAQIPKIKTNRLSPYVESELWERNDLLAIVKYEAHRRNKAALTLLWDLDARNHEVALLQIKHVRLRDRYGEAEIPHQSKTGGGPALLMCSFPYVRDWLNEHPFRNEPNARVICNLMTGGAVHPDALTSILKQLRKRIIALTESGSITDQQERETLEHLINTKKWSAYCIRHSAITADSDYLPEYALKKKARWSMNSKQPSRYIKARMGNDLKQKILLQNGIISEADDKPKPSIADCPRCSLVNCVDNKYCSKCSYPLTPSAFDEIKEQEDSKFKSLEARFNAMQSKLEHLVAGLERIVDQKTLTTVSKSLFSSGILEVAER